MQFKSNRLLLALLTLATVFALFAALPLMAYAADVSFAPGGDVVTTPVNGLTVAAAIRPDAAYNGYVLVSAWLNGAAAEDTLMVLDITTSAPGVTVFFPVPLLKRYSVTAGQAFDGNLNFNPPQFEAYIKLPNADTVVNDLRIFLSTDTVHTDATAKSLAYCLGNNAQGPWIPVPGFSPTVFDYHIEVPLGTNHNTIYLRAEPNDPYISGSGGGSSGYDPLIASAKYYAEDRVSMCEYTVKFTWATGGDPVVPAYITWQPYDQVAAVGGQAAFFVMAAGSPAPKYMWQVLDKNRGGFVTIEDGGVYSGATTDTLRLTGIPLDFDGLEYRCIVYNEGGGTVDATSRIVKLTVLEGRRLSAGNVSFAPGGDEVTTAVNGLTAVAELWSADGVFFLDAWLVGTALEDKVMVLDITTSIPGVTITFPIYLVKRYPVTAGQEYLGFAPGAPNFQARILLSAADMKVDDLRISLSTDTLHTDASAKSLSYCLGNNARGPWIPVPGFDPKVFNYAVELPLGAVENIYVRGEANDPYISGAGNGGSGYGTYVASVDFTAEDRVSKCEYFISFTWSTEGDPVTPAYITKQPDSITIRAGGSASFSVEAKGGPAPSYMWQVIDINHAGPFVTIVDNDIYSGATTATLTLKNVPLDYDGLEYWCIAYNIGGGTVYATSNLVKLNVLEGRRISVNGVELDVEDVGGVAVIKIGDAGKMEEILTGEEIVFDLSAFDAVDIQAAAALFAGVDKEIVIITANGVCSVKTKALWNNSGKDRLIQVRNNKVEFFNIK